MFFKSIDKFFDQIKYFISVVIFALITMASFLFLYWLLFSAKIVMPDWTNTFVWSVIDFLAQGFKGTDLYKGIIPILPVLASGVFIIITYVANCVLVFLENNHRRFQYSVDNYKTKLEKTINHELQKSFIEELKKSDFMMVKIKIVVTKQSSYLSAATEDNISAQDIEKHITNLILNTVKSEYILKKGISNGSVFFLLSDLNASKEFFLNLVSTSVKLISSHVKSKLKIGFYCGAELFNDIAEEAEKSQYLDRVIELKVENKIVVTPKFKLYFDNVAPELYSFKVVGEYNISGKPHKSSITMFYSLHKRI